MGFKKLNNHSFLGNQLYQWLRGYCKKLLVLFAQNSIGACLMTKRSYFLHAYAKKLKAVGFTEDQTEVQAQALAEIIDERLVTRQYFEERLAVLEANVITKITKWVAGMLVAQAAIVATLVKLL